MTLWFDATPLYSIACIHRMIVANNILLNTDSSGTVDHQGKLRDDRLPVRAVP